MKDGTNEYFDKLKLAEDFCKGDLDQARKLLSGELQDIVVIKSRFKREDDSYYGLFMLFINKSSLKIVKSFSIATNIASVFLTKPFVTWKEFALKMQKEAKSGNFDKKESAAINGALKRNIIGEKAQNLLDWIETNDIKAITQYFQNIISNKLEMDDIILVLDFEDTNSLILHESLGLQPDASYTTEDDTKKTDYKQRVDAYEKKFAGKIITAKAEVSPVKGKYIHLFTKGDPIRAIINGDSQLSMDTAKKHNAYVGGKMVAIDVKVIENIKTNTGYIIYTQTDDDIIVKVIEKPGVKVNTNEKPKMNEYEVKPMSRNIRKKSTGSKSNTLKILLISALALAFAIGIIYVILA